MRAIALLCLARLLVAVIPFERWRNSLGAEGSASLPEQDSLARARRLAADVEWAAKRLPFPTKCLPRAMALSWVLRRARIGHAVIIAVRPVAMRDAPDGLHAWVEADGETILGNLPGPWLETLRLDGGPQPEAPSPR